VSEIPLEGPEVPLDQVEALSALEKALGDALSQVPREQVLSRVIAMFPATATEIDSNQISRFHGRVQKVSVSMPEDLATAIREHTGPGGFSRFVAEAAERQLKNEQLRELLDELEAESGPIPDEMREQARRHWLSFYEGE
jgi:Arc/MetJ-type ribon-helix-helix transcriptional regulator